MPPPPAAAGPFPVYVPRLEGQSQALAHVLRGSAIVGFRLAADPTKIHVYYEGNAGGAHGLLRFADRAKHAAGRCRWYRLDIEQWRRNNPGEPLPETEHGYIAYPTAAQAIVDADALVWVALYDDVLGIVLPTGPEQAALLAAWIGSTEPEEHFATGAEFDQRREDALPPDSDGRAG
jgi:hypothetical protein